MTAALVPVLIAGLTPLLASPAGAVGARYADDFNGDGYRDLVIGTPYGSPNGVDRAGFVSVVYGSATGLGPSEPAVISQNSADIPGAAEADDNFGNAFTSADLDADGYADLVVGTPYEDVGTVRDQGATTILWGSRTGLSGGAGVANKAAAIDGYFGDVLAAGDFTGDGYPDLAVVQRDYTLRLYKGPFTRTGAPKAIITKKLTIGAEKAIAGKINKTGGVDLVTVNSDTTQVLLGTSTGFSATSKTMTGGESATVGDFDKDGYGDVAVGRGWADVGGVTAAGRVGVAYGSSSGLSTTRSTWSISQSSAGVPGTPEQYDHFGSDVSAGDVTGDGYADLLVGVSSENNRGGATVLKGSATGLSGSGAWWISPDAAGMPYAYGTDFGNSVRIRDTNGDSRPDTAIGDCSANGWRGAVWSLPSNATGPVTTGSKIIHAPGTSAGSDLSTEFGILLG
ncbi:FG-GAP and VCBS repeat-containing protein [Streptomyces sp. NBC_01717]|uniref:FG-GAP repeat protein n=1 Tax=Streptomyces sp. NBC_01717 TaxID=2975918 RepID=UPI002E36B900|nr:FG-GAP repeat protein [Streptomyces sp. NBC_01717]